MSDPNWIVYGTCPTCHGIVSASPVLTDTEKAATSERIRQAGFLAYPVNQGKVFEVGYRLKASCSHSHEMPADDGRPVSRAAL